MSLLRYVLERTGLTLRLPLRLKRCPMCEPTPLRGLPSKKAFMRNCTDCLRRHACSCCLGQTSTAINLELRKFYAPAVIKFSLASLTIGASADMPTDFARNAPAQPDLGLDANVFKRLLTYRYVTASLAHICHGIQ